MSPSFCECWRQCAANIIVNLLCSFGGFASVSNSSFQSTVPVSYTHLDVYKRQIIDYVAGRILVRISGGYDFVDVRDVAKGHILAAEKGKTGDKYILSGEWISMDDVMKEISAITNVPVPRFQLPVGLASAVAYALTLYSVVTGAKVLMNRDSISTLRSNSLVSCDKAKRELGYSPRPIRETIRDTVRWFQETGVL